MCVPVQIEHVVAVNDDLAFFPAFVDQIRQQILFGSGAALHVPREDALVIVFDFDQFGSDAAAAAVVVH